MRLNLSEQDIRHIENALSHYKDTDALNGPDEVIATDLWRGARAWSPGPVVLGDFELRMIIRALDSWSAMFEPGGRQETLAQIRVARRRLEEAVG